MHIYFSGIGGTGVGPLAQVAKEVGYEVSGSDLKDSQYIKYLTSQGITGIHIGQTSEQISALHTRKPIDWFVYTSALPKNHPELLFCRENGIKTTKRDALLNTILSQKKLSLLAIAGTHGKTTTTAMLIWLFKQLSLPVSYSVGAKISFGNMGHFEPSSKYFVYECDEFDHHFLAFNPYLTMISGIAWDHHEIFPSQEEYFEAFRQFLIQSQWKIIWQEDLEKLAVRPDKHYLALNYQDKTINEIRLRGVYNRRNAWLAVNAMHELTKEPVAKLIELINRFPGLSRRFEKLAESLYSDYAHTPDKIRGVMSVVQEVAAQAGQKIVIIYEPLTNRRMHYMARDHHSVFEGADVIYWVPSYLAREDPSQAVLTPAQLIEYLNPRLQKIAKPMELDEKLKTAINEHLQKGDLVVALSGGGADSLDEWLRKTFVK